MATVHIFSENLKAILALIDEGVHAIDKRGYTIFYNEVAASLDGLSPEEVIGRHILEVFPSLSQETSTLLKVVSGGEKIVNQRQTFMNYKGRMVTTVNTTVPIYHDGELIGAVEISKDITQLKNLSEKIIHLQAELNKAKDIAEEDAGQAKFTFENIIGENPAFLALKRLAIRAAQSSSPVLVFGETGTGKELFVQAMHNASGRRTGPFVAQNCAAFPESLLEGILFGTVKGSFTGAENRPGLFELAHGGTLFLDEINSMDLSLQAKLLRVLQDGTFRRVGDTRVRRADVRIMAATNVDPQSAVAEGKLRKDLYYRINVVSLGLPPLRARRDDLPLFIEYFIRKFNERLSRKVKGVSPEVMNIFYRYDWPGNVRELEHVIEGAMNLTPHDIITADYLPPALRQTVAAGADDWLAVKGVRPLRQALDCLEAHLVREAMSQARGNISEAARLLHIPRQTLQYKLKMLDVQK